MAPTRQRRWRLPMPNSHTSSIAELFANSRVFGNRPAVGLRSEYGLRWFTFHDLFTVSSNVCRLLESLGINAGDCILIWSSNRPEWVACLVGALLRRVIVVPVDEGASQEFIHRITAE